MSDDAPPSAVPSPRPSPGLTRRACLGAGLAVLAPRLSARAAASPAVLEAGALGSGSAAGLGYNGTSPGPALRVRRGEALSLSLRNRLAEPTGLYIQGLRGEGGGRPLPAPLAPGGEAALSFAPRDAGTYFYRPPGGAQGVAQQAAGLGGAFIVEDKEPPGFDRDVVLLFDMRRSGEAVRLLVNGQESVAIDLRRNERVRLRLINGAACEVAMLAFVGPLPTIVALDGRPVDSPFPADQRLDLAPGGRADMVLDATFADPAPAIAMAHGEAAALMVRFALSAEPALRGAPLAPPAGLPRADLPAGIDLAAALRAELTLDDAATGEAPVFSVPRGRPVAMRIANPGETIRSVHLHGHCARLLHALDDGWDPAWFDTLLVYPRETIGIAFVPDTAGRWALDLRAMGRPEAARLRWFEVT